MLGLSLGQQDMLLAPFKESHFDVWLSAGDDALLCFCELHLSVILYLHQSRLC
jgi:hypothetical protein